MQLLKQITDYLTEEEEGDVEEEEEVVVLQAEICSERRPGARELERKN